MVCLPCVCSRIDKCSLCRKTEHWGQFMRLRVQGDSLFLRVGVCHLPLSTLSLGQVLFCVRPAADAWEVQVMRPECRAGEHFLGSKQACESRRRRL